ncbi:MAG: CAP domain-containing protein [Syntrophotaleaceae bacterium]
MNRQKFFSMLAVLSALLFLWILPPASLSETAAGGAISGQRTGSDLTQEEVQQLLEEHNRVRAEVGTNPVSWSPSVAAHAQEWADHLAAGACRMKHRPATGQWAGPYGENLFIGTAGYYGVVDAARGWESEKRDYEGDPIDRSNFQEVGHYTQMVWSETREIGCGKAQCEGKVIIVCNYNPPGNVLGQKPY